MAGRKPVQGAFTEPVLHDCMNTFTSFVGAIDITSVRQSLGWDLKTSEKFYRSLKTPEHVMEAAKQERIMPYYEFGPFRVNTVKCVLLRDGEVVPLSLKAFEILLALIEHRGQVLEKNELLKRVWPDTVVEENNLARNISALRKALDEQPNEHQYILTVPGRGYRFVASVREVNGAR